MLVNGYYQRFCYQRFVTKMSSEEINSHMVFNKWRGVNDRILNLGWIIPLSPRSNCLLKKYHVVLLMANSQALDTSGLFHKGHSMFTCLLWRSMYSQMVPTTLLCPLCQACLDHIETSPEGIRAPRLLLWRASIYFLREWHKIQRWNAQKATLDGNTWMGGVAWLRHDITETSVQLLRLHRQCFVLHESKVPVKQMHKWNLKSHNLHKQQNNNCISFYYTFPAENFPGLFSRNENSSQHLELRLTQCRRSPETLPDFPSFLSESFTSDIIWLQDAVTARGTCLKEK